MPQVNKELKQCSKNWLLERRTRSDDATATFESERSELWRLCK